MSFREKTAWISLLSMSGIYGMYFWSVVRSGSHTGGLLGTVIALVMVQVTLTIAVAIFDPKQAKAPADERDRLIVLKSTRVAYAALATSVVCACFFGAFNPPIIFNTNALLFVLVVAEILRSGCQVIQYRRGA
ncbi:MAG TPA: hypothetical protein VMG40_02445 [Bryobacteraceae bacterium]|nr:hypothetical protein [Bryobacteraceae bacterium]